MALIKRKKPKPKAKPLTLEEQLELAPGAPTTYTPGTNWQDIINADPLLGQDIGDLASDEIGDKAWTMAALKQALIRMGGSGLAGLVGKLGPEWADLLDPTTLAAAADADRSGISVNAQLGKRNKDRLLAEEDVRAAKGILSSGQSGYEIGEARQANTLAVDSAVSSLLSGLSGGIHDFAGRQGERNRKKAEARDAAMRRALDMGLEPTPPKLVGVQAPPTPLSLAKQLRKNAKRPIRRPIGGYE